MAHWAQMRQSGEPILHVDPILDNAVFETAVDPESMAYKSIFDNAVVGIYQTTVDGRFLRVNPALAEMFGYADPSDLIASVTDIAGQLYVDPTRRAAFAAALAGDGRLFGFEAEVYRRDGSTIWIKENARRVIDAVGTILFYEGVVTDITQQKRVERKNQLLVSAFASVAEGIVVIDRAATVRAINAAYGSLFDVSAEQLINHPFRLPFDESGTAPSLETLCDYVETMGHWEGEIRVPPPDPRDRTGTMTIALSASAVSDDFGAVDHFILVFSDVTRHKLDEQTIRFHTNYDALTGLPNRQQVRDRLGQALLTAGRGGMKVAVALVDLDRFKQINDTLGHHAGDLLLRQAGRRLRNAVRLADTVGRFGGDEFVIIANDIKDRAAALQLGKRIRQSFMDPFRLIDRDIYCQPSVGLAIFPDDGDSADQLLRNADVAMEHCKKRGGATYAFYSRELQNNTQQRLDLETDLRSAVDREQLTLHYQPKVQLDDGRITGAEALLRWQHPRLGTVPPGHFIALAEDTGMIRDIGLWSLREACRQMRAWQTMEAAPESVSVNLSPSQFQSRHVVETVARVLEDSGIEPRQLELELTEGAMIVDMERAVATLKGLKQLGVRLAIDDFGTGYSSLSYLKRFPLDTIKIDRSFVQDLEASHTDAEIIQAIIALARSLRFTVIAEGVERPGQAAILHRHACAQIQGFLVSPALPADAFTDFVRRHAGTFGRPWQRRTAGLDVVPAARDATAAPLGSGRDL